MEECKEIQAMLSDYLDRDLPPDTCAGIDAHMRSCRRCEGAAASLRATIALCRDLRESDAPGPLADTKHSVLRDAFERALKSLRENP